MKVLLRADGNGEIGYGHLSRLNALANIIGQEFKVIFLTRYDSNISLIESNIEIVIIPKEVNLTNESCRGGTGFLKKSPRTNNGARRLRRQKDCSLGS